ncbi:MAG TPA: hypothetical protein PLX89_23565 [Verrucomicrobiota bacterium]|nr:hypothetical protein [Verrucomicrobiales bacterium]HRI15987.1 hypothetical protein [Verrucomicrobiota bacterium]
MATECVGFGVVQRTTAFTVKFAGTGTATRASFVGFRLLPNGHPGLRLTGTAGKVYTIQRVGNLDSPTGNSVGPATMNASGASGAAVFEDTDSGLTFPAFSLSLSN